MKLLKMFARMNLSVCSWLERTFSGFFDPKLGGATYLPDIRDFLTPWLDGGGSRILEVGGIDRPILERGEGFTFAGLDIEAKERCDEVYDEFTVQSVEDEIAPGNFDVIYSVTVLEHVPDNTSAARSMFAAQRPGGCGVHYVPCMWHPYGVLLRLVGNSLQRRLLSLVAVGDKPMGGYPTFFDRCTPARMEKTFRDAGYGEVETHAYYSPTPYFRAFVPVHILVVLFMHVARILRWRSVCSGFLLVARK